MDNLPAIPQEPRKRVNKKEKSTRILEVASMYYDNKGDKQVLKKKVKAKWGLQTRQAENYIKEAMELVKNDSDPDLKAAKAKWLHEMWEIYYDLKEDEDANKKILIEALREIGKMLGLYSIEPQIAINVDNSKKVEIKKMSTEELQKFVAAGYKKSEELPPPTIDAEVVEEEENVSS